MDMTHIIMGGVIIALLGILVVVTLRYSRARDEAHDLRLIAEKLRPLANRRRQR